MLAYLSRRIRHFFHVVSNVRPIIWISMYVALTPIFALIYWALPDWQFRIPDGAGTDFGSWLYYSIVTITTLGFGDYTPAHAAAQAVTAVEVMCGLVILGFFLNAVGAMKSEIDVESEIEKQRALHNAAQKDRLLKSIPSILHNINIFLSYCYAATTPAAQRGEDGEFNDNFKTSDLQNLLAPSGLPIDHTNLPVVHGLMKSAASTALYLDSLQNKIDLTLWPDLLEDCFAFVANYQIVSTSDAMAVGRSKDAENEVKNKEMSGEIYNFIRSNGKLARNIETVLTKIANEKNA